MKEEKKRPQKRSVQTKAKKRPFRSRRNKSERFDKSEREDINGRSARFENKKQSNFEKEREPLADLPVSWEAHGAFTELNEQIQRAIGVNGYDTPTPIQEQCIPHLLEGQDLIGSAQTGTGKTAAFTLPLLQKLHKNNRRPRRGVPRALILSPTRELAAQIGESIETYGRFTRISHTVIYGGVKQFGQVRALNRGVDILVATPGRLLDLFEQGHLELNKVSTFVLDEVDRMLDMGFVPDIKRVLNELPTNSERQTAFFSATMPPKVRELAQTMVKPDAMHVTIAPDKPAVERIEQKILFVHKKNKDALLLSLLSDKEINKVIIFTQMKHAANQMVEKLEEAGIRGTAIHGNKTQAARTRALNGFKNGRFKVLVATDVAARGLDVDDITHVINYDLPTEAETYVHRIGRTGRAGADGDAISFCCAEDRALLRDIDKLLGNPIPHEMDHPYHCDEAYRSRMSAPDYKGKGSQGRGRGRSSRRFNGGGSRGPRSGGSRRDRGGRSRFRGQRRKESVTR